MRFTVFLLLLLLLFFLWCNVYVWFLNLDKLIFLGVLVSKFKKVEGF